MKKIKFWKKKFDKKQNNKESKGSAVKTLLKILPVILVLVVLGFAVKGVSDFLFSSPYFFVKDADVYIDGKIALPQISSRYGVNISSNIFKVDLASIRASIYRKHLEIRRITLSRRLPNRVSIDIEIREAVVQVKADKYYPVDKDGIVLIDITDEPNPRLPVLAGAQGKISALSIGTKIDTQNFKEAKELLKAIIKSDFLRKHKFLYIDCYDYKNLSFYIDKDLEIKMGRQNYDEKLNTLAKIFDKLDKDATDIKYIDLRFRDVVIGPKLEK